MGEPVSDPLVGTVLDGRYRVLRRLAHGGMATVYEATDTRLDRTVALKVMHAGLASDRDFVDRFIREARAAARLSHPNVVAVFDQSADSGHVFLAMEYVDGRTLRDWLRDKHHLTPRETFAVLEPVLAALAAAHRAGLIHRDVKPENVLIAEDGRVKVADFGLARAVSTASSAITRAGTGAGALIGTVAYLSPEQVEHGSADQRSDVYAAGILLYECLTGLQPFSGDTPIQVAYQHVHHDVPRPSDQVAELPPALDDLVLRATARDPASRPADAAVLLAEAVRVRQALRPEALDLGAVGGGPAPAPAGGSPTLVVEDGTAGVDPDATVVRPRASAGSTTQRGPARPAPPYPVPPRLARRRRRGALALLTVLLAAFGVGLGAWQVAVGSSVTTPSLLSLSREDAIAKAAEAGLEVRFIADEFDEVMPAGQVLRTDPEPGRRVAKSGTITAVLSKGPERYVVPDLRDIPAGDAQSRLAEANFTVAEDLTERFHNSIEAGRVIRTDPPAGATLRRDAVVELVVSRGVRPVDLPDVVGKDVDEATGILEDLGFEVSVVEEDTNSAPNGQVISQQPSGDRSVPKGSTIELTVARSTVVEMPRVIGMDDDEAKELLERLGFAVRVQRFAGNFGSRVIAQDPDPGDRVPYGSTVTIRVF